MTFLVKALGYLIEMLSNFLINYKKIVISEESKVEDIFINWSHNVGPYTNTN